MGLLNLHVILIEGQNIPQTEERQGMLPYAEDEDGWKSESRERGMFICHQVNWLSLALKAFTGSFG